MIHPEHLREDVIRPVLESMGAWSTDAEELLLLTAAQESHLGKYLHQINGPALGIYQMEPATYEDIWSNYLKYKDGLAEEISKWHLVRTDSKGYEQMKGNMYYATAMARAHYLRRKEPLPDHNDVEAMAAYYKQYWNTPLGAATVEEAITNYKRFAQA